MLCWKDTATVCDRDVSMAIVPLEAYDVELSPADGFPIPTAGTLLLPSISVPNIYCVEGELMLATTNCTTKGLFVVAEFSPTEELYAVVPPKAIPIFKLIVPPLLLR